MSVDSKMTAIADAIRSKTSITTTLTLDQMAEAILSISGTSEGEITGVIEGDNIYLSGDVAEGVYNVMFRYPEGSTEDIGVFAVGGVRYIQCEYIQNADDASYIDLGITNTETTGVLATFDVTVISALHGYCAAYGNNDIVCGFNGLDDMRGYHGGVKSYQLVARLAANTKYTVGVNYLNCGKTSIDGVEKA